MQLLSTTWWVTILLISTTLTEEEENNQWKSLVGLQTSKHFDGIAGTWLKALSEGYWSSFSRSPMFSRFSISFLMPLIQDCASSADSATRSRLPLRPRKTSVKHRSAGNSSAMLSSTSDWWPSRIASTSLTETGRKGQHRMENWVIFSEKQSVMISEWWEIYCLMSWWWSS